MTRAIKTSKPPEFIVCHCGNALGDLMPGGNWVAFKNPLICQNCGEDNTGRIRDHILAGV